MLLMAESSAMTFAIFRYAIGHIFMADFWLSAMNRHPPLTTLVPTAMEANRGHNLAMRGLAYVLLEPLLKGV